MDEDDAFSFYSSLIEIFSTASAVFLTLSSEDHSLGVCLLVLKKIVGIWVSWGKTKNKNSSKAKPFYSPAIQFSCTGNGWTNMSDQSVNWHEPSSEMQ